MTAGIFLRFVGFIYFFAFYSLWIQADGLYGDAGVVPVRPRVERLWNIAEAERWDGLELFARYPTLCLIDPSPEFFKGLCAAGSALALGLGLLGLCPAPILALLWLFYLSLATVDGVFAERGWSLIGYQQNALLLETGFLAIFLAPWRWRTSPSRDPEPPLPMVWALRLLLFRLMFSSGYGKFFQGSDAWRDLSALVHHYETQPLPTWGGWIFHQGPADFHKFSVACVFVIQVFAPFLIFAPRRPRFVAGGLLAGLQLLIFFTGNYGLFNLLGLALCLMVWDDRSLRAMGRFARDLWPRKLQARLAEGVRARWDAFAARVLATPQGAKLREVVQAFREGDPTPEKPAPAPAEDAPKPGEPLLPLPEGAKPRPRKGKSAKAKASAASVGVEQLDFLAAMPEQPGPPPPPPAKEPAKPQAPPKPRRRTRKEWTRLVRSRALALLRGTLVGAAACATLLFGWESFSGMVFRGNPPDHWLLNRWERLREESPALRGALDAARPWRLSSRYGLFLKVTSERPELLIEGSYDGERWLPYEFKAKPGDLARRPGFVAPIHPYLDWQMWFAALWVQADGWPAGREAWANQFMLRLLEGSPAVEGLMARNPFHSEPPRFVRPMMCDYRFSTPGEWWAEGRWWEGRVLGQCGPTLTLDRRGKLTVHSPEQEIGARIGQAPSKARRGE